MSKAANYSAVELMRNGRSVEIRALRLDDRADLVAAVDRASSQSLYRRFFSPKRSFTEKEVAYFLNPDFVSHVALVAVVDEPHGRAIVGGGRYVVMKPGTAEIAFAVVDEYQGQRIGAALMRHLAAIACQAGLRELVERPIRQYLHAQAVGKEWASPQRHAGRWGGARDAALV